MPTADGRFKGTGNLPEIPWHQIPAEEATLTTMLESPQATIKLTPEQQRQLDTTNTAFGI